MLGARLQLRLSAATVFKQFLEPHMNARLLCTTSSHNKPHTKGLNVKYPQCNDLRICCRQSLQLRAQPEVTDGREYNSRRVQRQRSFHATLTVSSHACCFKGTHTRLRHYLQPLGHKGEQCPPHTYNKASCSQRKAEGKNLDLEHPVVKK